MPASPSLRRRRLAAELRRLRDQSGLSTTEAAKKLGWQPSRISRIETRQSGITAPDLRKLLNEYGVDDTAYRASLAELARRVNERGWWQKYAGLIGSEYADLIGLEAEARTIRTYQQELVPGLLQTPDYARAVIRASPPGRDPDGAARGPDPGGATAAPVQRGAQRRRRAAARRRL
jgi:transcriptional regulator with XRE-family HTH domain